MAIEKIGEDGFVVTGKDIQVYVLLSIHRTLRSEIMSGMKFSRKVNVAQQARDVLEYNGIHAPRNKIKLFVTYSRFLNDIGVTSTS